MKIVEYASQYAEPLASALSKVEFATPLLRHESFVRHFFLGYAGCRLHLLLSDDAEVIATLGSERIRLHVAGVSHDAAVLSNTYSMRDGAFSFLYLQWMKASGVGIMFPGNALLKSMLARQKRWQAVPGLRTYWLNWPYPGTSQDPFWKAALKPLARRLTRVNQETFPQRIAAMTAGELAVVEEIRVTEDMTDRRRGAFGFQLAPDTEYLNWRFCTSLEYVRYRIFRVLKRNATCGYVVLAEWPHCVVVSHCDGDDPRELALGVLLAIAALNHGKNRYRKVLLTSMHRLMQSIFHEFGFRPNPGDAPFCVAALGNSKITIEPGADWLVNMDLGDSGTVAGIVYKE